MKRNPSVAAGGFVGAAVVVVVGAAVVPAFTVEIVKLVTVIH